MTILRLYYCLRTPLAGLPNCSASTNGCKRVSGTIPGRFNIDATPRASPQPTHQVHRSGINLCSTKRSAKPEQPNPNDQSKTTMPARPKTRTTKIRTTTKHNDQFITTNPKNTNNRTERLKPERPATPPVKNLSRKASIPLTRTRKEVPKHSHPSHLLDVFPNALGKRSAVLHEANKAESRQGMTHSKQREGYADHKPCPERTAAAAAA